MADTVRQIGIDLDIHRAIERARVSFGESEKRILRRCCSLRVEAAAPAGAAPGPARGEPRRRGFGRSRSPGASCRPRTSSTPIARCCANFAASQPHSSRPLAKKRGRGRRLVARTPEALFETLAHLAGVTPSARSRLVFRFEPFDRAGRQARPNRRAALRPALRLGRAHPRQSARDLRRGRPGPSRSHREGWQAGPESARPADGRPRAEPDRRHGTMVPWRRVRPRPPPARSRRKWCARWRRPSRSGPCRRA